MYTFRRRIAVILVIRFALQLLAMASPLLVYSFTTFVETKSAPLESEDYLQGVGMAFLLLATETF